MASASGKKKNKTNWKTMQADYIQYSSGRSCSWADEMESQEETYDHKNLVLPTAPRASCMVAIDESKVPHMPPFQAHLSNLPYELTESELGELFPDLKVKEVRIPKEDRGNRHKGFGYVEFEDRASLLTALHKGEDYVKGRAVRIELATSDSGRGGGRSRGSQRSDSGAANSSSVDRTGGNWRSGPREEVEERDRGFDRGGPRREYGQGGGFSRREDNFQERRDDRYQPRDRGGERFRDDRPRNDDWGSRDSERRFRRDDRERSEPLPRNDPASEPKSRPKFQLLPRSSNLPPPTATSNEQQSTSNSIFGNAKPVDTSAKLMMIEERLAKSDMLGDNKSRSGGSSTGSSGGPPRPEPSKERKMEPAQPPKENAWGKSRLPQQQEKRASRPDEKKDI